MSGARGKILVRGLIALEILLAIAAYLIEKPSSTPPSDGVPYGYGTSAEEPERLDVAHFGF